MIKQEQFTCTECGEKFLSRKGSSGICPPCNMELSRKRQDEKRRLKRIEAKYAKQKAKYNEPTGVLNE